jgi:hypothetical protein
MKLNEIHLSVTYGKTLTDTLSYKYILLPQPFNIYIFYFKIQAACFRCSYWLGGMGCTQPHEYN